MGPVFNRSIQFSPTYAVRVSTDRELGSLCTGSLGGPSLRYSPKQQPWCLRSAKSGCSRKKVTPGGTVRTADDCPCATALEQCLFSRERIIHPQRLISRPVPPDSRLIRHILPPLQSSATLDPEPRTLPSSPKPPLFSARQRLSGPIPAFQSASPPVSSSVYAIEAGTPATIDGGRSVSGSRPCGCIHTGCRHGCSLGASFLQ